MRGKRTGTVIALLTGLLLALPPLLCSNSFATAHTARHAEAKAVSGKGLPAEAMREETVTRRTRGNGSGSGTDPTGLPPPDDRRHPPRPAPGRHGHATATEAGPAASREGPALTGPHGPTGRHRPPGPGPAPTPAALQVFRC